MNVINKAISLSLNKKWQAVNVRTIGQAIVDLCSSSMRGDDSCEALDMDFEVLEDGSIDFDNATNIRPVTWEEWITLEVRNWDIPINTPNMVIRAPLITVAKKYEKMPRKLFRKTPSKDGVRVRDNNRCQYSNRILKPSEGSLDHIIPKSRGGKDSWDNIVYCDRSLNSKKGNKLNSEIGLKLIKLPTTPRPMEAWETITEAKHGSWKPFLVKT